MECPVAPLIAGQEIYWVSGSPEISLPATAMTDLVTVDPPAVAVVAIRDEFGDDVIDPIS